MKKPMLLSVKNLMELFGVTAMTLHNWKRRTATRTALPAVRTPAVIRNWATMNGVPMTCAPSTLLGKDVGKPGPRPKVVNPSKAGEITGAGAASNPKRGPSKRS